MGKKGAKLSNLGADNRRYDQYQFHRAYYLYIERIETQPCLNRRYKTDNYPIPIAVDEANNEHPQMKNS